MKYRVEFKCCIKDYNYVLKKILDSNICIIDSSYKNKEYYFTTYEEDYNYLLESDYKKVIIYVGYKGLENIIDVIKKNVLYFIITVVIVCIIFLSNLFIIKINVHTNDLNLKRKITYFLADNNLKNFSLKKSYKRLSSIKNNLLNKYKSDIEWIEITPNGYEYNVYIIERKKDSFSKSNERCNYVAKKSATITKIKARKGVLMVQQNNYVQKGDILISGDIIYNDELKKEVCASGKIYGEVWYEVDVSYPLLETSSKENKNKFYNISINLFNKEYKFLKNKYNEQTTIKKIGNDIFGINLISSSKKYEHSKKISETEATKLALKKTAKSIYLKTNNKSQILSQNILKKYVKNDTIYMKVLITVEEEIGVVERY